nr:unnamed protein product [Callosobruchus chinensis]
MPSGGGALLSPPPSFRPATLTPLLTSNVHRHVHQQLRPIAEHFAAHFASEQSVDRRNRAYVCIRARIGVLHGDLGKLVEGGRRRVGHLLLHVHHLLPSKLSNSSLTLEPFFFFFTSCALNRFFLSSSSSSSIVSRPSSKGVPSDEHSTTFTLLVEKWPLCSAVTIAPNFAILRIVSSPTYGCWKYFAENRLAINNLQLSTTAKTTA